MANPYQVAVAIAMSSNHGAVLGALSQHLLGIHGQVNQLHGGFSRLKVAIGGALAVGAGTTILSTMVKLVDKTKEYSDELVKLERMGGAMERDVRSGAAANLAFDVGARSNMKVTDVMKIQGQTYSILGEDGKKVLEPLAKFAFLLQGDKHFKGDAGAELGKFLRAGEIGGRLTDPKTHKAAIEEVTKFLELSQKAITFTHGMVTPSSILAQAQQAGYSMRGMDEKGFMTMAIYNQAMGGHRSGTALLSLFQQLATGKGTKAAALGMKELGLLKGSEITSDHGKVLIASAAKDRLGKLISRDPLDLIDTIYANLEKRGITDPQKQMQMVADALSRATSQRFVAEGMMSRDQMKAERARAFEALGSGATSDLTMNKSVGANMQALSNAWDRLLMAIAGPNSQNTIGILKFLTTSINDFTAYIRTVDPNTIMNIAKGFAALGAVLIGAGGVAIIAALGPAGWIVLGAAGVAGAMHALSKVDWKGLGAYITPAVNSVIGAMHALAQVNWKGIGDALANFARYLLESAESLGVKALHSLGIDKGGTHTSPGKTGKPAVEKQTMFAPGVSPQKEKPIALSLNVDGRTLAQAVSEQLALLSEHNTNSPDFNGAASYGP